MKQDYKDGKRKGFEKGHSVPQEWRDKVRKAVYKGGESRNHHCGLVYKKWRISVFERDNYTCQECGRRNIEGLNLYLEAHHKFSWKIFPEFRYKLWNGITLCRECHKKITLQQRSCKHIHKEKYQICGECGKITKSCKKWTKIDKPNEK